MPTAILVPIADAYISLLNPKHETLDFRVFYLQGDLFSLMTYLEVY
ncbi:hypothetical protein DE171_005278 [Clostridium beijerinckii]|nr:hypothetical protein [Clostridium beijerinckii]